MKLVGRPSPLLTSMLVVAGMAVAAWISFDHYDQRRQRFEQLASELDQALALARQIELLRQKPDRAASQSRSDQSLAELIEKSAHTAGVALEQIARIEPQQPRRAGESDYLDHSTVIQFDGVGLPQLASMLAALRGSPGLEQLRVSTLRLAAPFQTAQSGDAEVWNVELTLTYYVYSPKTPSPRKS